MNQTSLTVSRIGVGVFPPILTSLFLPNPTSHNLAWGGNKKNAKIPPVNNYPNEFYNYKISLIQKKHKLFSPVDIYPFYFYNYNQNDKLLVTFSMGVLN